MPVPANISDSTAINASMDQEFIRNFEGDLDRLLEVLGIFGAETIAAGTTLKMLKVTGELNDSKTDGSKESATGDAAVQLGSSSGTAYVEGDEVALSKFTATYEPVGEAEAFPYRRMTTHKAIQRSGYVNAVLKTDKHMASLVRRSIVSRFFSFLLKGTGAATGKGLQACAAAVDAKLGNTLETNGDAAERVVHFINRDDAADYLGNATITDQNLFGLTYLENFLGLSGVFLTNQVAKGTMIATPADNIRIFGVDFGELATSGLTYTVSDSGLIGVVHTPAYDHVSVETNVLAGATFFPEVKDYIVKGTITTK